VLLVLVELSRDRRLFQAARPAPIDGRQAGRQAADVGARTARTVDRIVVGLVQLG
jgi:hypothetical protein